jgi:hypothetical protein
MGDSGVKPGSQSKKKALYIPVELESKWVSKNLCCCAQDVFPRPHHLESRLESYLDWALKMTSRN